MKKNPSTDIENKIERLPAGPGVYIMKDPKGEVLYIGKARNLRARVRSYFRRTGDTRYAARYLASKVADIECIVTANEKEALILEDTLLKKYRPRYNIRLKDDKTYVSIKITTAEKFPRILVTRRIVKDGSRYFGPYGSAKAVRDTIKLIRKIFPLCVCSLSEFRNRVRPCLDYQLGLCSAPAAGLISEEEYRELVKGAVMFLEGRNKTLLKELREKMDEASKRLDFERAAKLRDQIRAVESVLEEQKVVTHRPVDQDVFALVKKDSSVAVQVLFVREGRLINTRAFIFKDTGIAPEEMLSSVVSQFYRKEASVPDEVLTNLELDDGATVAEWLSDRKGRKVVITRPRRGDKLRIVQMAEANARASLIAKAEEEKGPVDTLEALKKRLRLKNLPHRIEAYDVSNTGGDKAVGAMVTFMDLEPDKKSYRLFRVRTPGPDDYAMMYEVLSRRFRNGGGLEMPDLVLVDGGKGQLNIAASVLKELGIRGVDLAALAKDRPVEKARTSKKAGKGERVYLPNVKDPILLREGSKEDLLLRRIRDEVHRFAVKYHRKLRGRITSVLDEIPGIGEKKKRLLLERFGDIRAIRDADVKELARVKGITPGLAERIKKVLMERYRGPEGIKDPLPA